MAYDPRNARAWLRDLTDGHPSLGLALCSWHAASTSVPMGWECIDERRGMRFGLDDVDEPEAGFLFTEDPTRSRRPLTEPRLLADPDTAVAEFRSSASLLGTEDSDLQSASTAASATAPSTDVDPVDAEPYVTRFDDRGRFGDTGPDPDADAEPDSAGATVPAPEPDSTGATLPAPEPVAFVDPMVEEDDRATAEPDLPAPEPMQALGRDPGRAPSVSYFDDDGYNEPIAIPLDEIDGIELGFEPLMAGDELNDLKLEAAERFTVIEPVAEDEFEAFETTPEPIVDEAPIDRGIPMAEPAAAFDAAADLDLGFEVEDSERVPHLVAVDPNAPAAPVDDRIDEVDEADDPQDGPRGFSDGFLAEPDDDPQGFSDDFLSEPIEEPPVWADDVEPEWRSEPEPEAPAQDDDGVERPRLFDDIGYAEIDDAEADRETPGSMTRSSDEEEIDPDDELSFDDIFPSMVNRPAARPAPLPESTSTPPPGTGGGPGDPSASMTQPRLPSIDADVPQLPDRRTRSHDGPEPVQPPVARSRRPWPSFDHLVFQEDPTAPGSSTAHGPQAAHSPAPSLRSQPLPRLFENNKVEVRQLSVDGSTPLLNRAFGFVPRD